MAEFRLLQVFIASTSTTSQISCGEIFVLRLCTGAALASEIDHAGRAGSADVIGCIASAERSNPLDAFWARISPRCATVYKSSAYVGEFMRTASASQTHEQDKSATKRHISLYISRTFAIRGSSGRHRPAIRGVTVDRAPDAWETGPLALRWMVERSVKNRSSGGPVR
jgi:hypothetical protein